MGKREDKITRAAHIKRHTRGTSNEISFSVLDAAKNALEGDDDGLKHRPGRISLFTLPGKRKKPAPTPTKERGLPLSTGGFVSVDDSGPTSKLGMIAPPSRSSGSTGEKPFHDPSGCPCQTKTLSRRRDSSPQSAASSEQMACDCGGRGGERRPVECGRRVPLSRLSNPTRTRCGT